MSAVIITIKLARGHAGPHDPRNKMTGPCPVSPSCSDVTGEHHSFLAESERAGRERAAAAGWTHITRIEAVS